MSFLFCIAGPFRLCVLLFSFSLLQFFGVLWVAADDPALHRALERGTRLDPVIIPIHTLNSRSPADNTTFGAGLSPVSFSSDRQSYFTIIKVGDFNFRVNLDTGSADLWLISTACNTNSCQRLPRFPLEFNSPTFNVVNDNSTVFKAQYADTTSASGFVARETITLANLSLTNQVFSVVTDSNVSLTDQTSGIMGLGFPRLSSISDSSLNNTSFFGTLAAQGLLEYPMFGFSLTRNSTGALTIGAIDASLVTNVSRISWNKVAQFPPFGAENNISSYLQWAIPIGGVAVNGTEITPIPTYKEAAQSRSLALFDIGTSGVFGPYQDVSRIFSMIDGARLVDPDGQWAIPCDTVVPMSFTFGQQIYTLLPTDYMIGPASGNPNLCLSWPRALPPNTDGIDWQIGSAFLRTVYSIFSYGIDGKEPPLIGFYSLQNTTNITQTPDDIETFFSANTATVPTTLPNFILPTPTFTTPPYALNASVSASIGGIVSSGLANSTYSALFGQKTSPANVSALPMITPPPVAVTLVVTDAAGDVATTVSFRSLAAVTLGLPSGASSIFFQSISTWMVALPCITLISVWTSFYT